jgi:signal transduction histidine kinase
MKQSWPRLLPNTLRGKLSLWYVGTTTFLFLVLIGFFSFLTWSALNTQIDHHIHVVIEEARPVVENYPTSRRDELLKRLVGSKGMIVTLLSPDGAAVVQTASTDIALTSEHYIQQIMVNSNWESRAPDHFSIQGIRFAAVPVSVNAGKGILAVGYSTDVIEKTFRQIVVSGTLILIFLLTPLSYLGYRLLVRQLQPVETLAISLKKVTDPNSLGVRIDTSTMTQELKTIAQAANQMLHRLEMTFQYEQDFFSDAAHTLKTPLAALRSHVESNQSPRKTKAEMLASLDRVMVTVEDLLYMAKAQSNSTIVEDFSLSELVEELGELVELLGAEKRLSVQSTIEPDINFRGNRGLIIRALGNLVQNAIHYSNKGGSITIQLTKEVSGTLFRVSDEGVGIDDHDLPHIYDRFYRGKNTITHKGSGLGLAISKSVIEAHGGKLTIESSLGKGTKVTVWL